MKIRAAVIFDDKKQQVHVVSQYESYYEYVEYVDRVKEAFKGKEPVELSSTFYPDPVTGKFSSINEHDTDVALDGCEHWALEK